MRKRNSKTLTAVQNAELKALAALPEEAINTRVEPEARNWQGAQRGVFFRPVKRQLTLRLDADLVDWFQAYASKGYQTRINAALREYVSRHTQKG